MAYRQAKNPNEFKNAQPQKRLYPLEEEALYEWALANGGWVSLADNKGNSSLKTIKCSLKVPPMIQKDLAPSMKILEGLGSTEGRGQGSAIETAMQENATLVYIDKVFNSRRVPTLKELQEKYPAVDDTWTLSFATTTKVLKNYLNNTLKYKISRDNGMFVYLEKLAKKYGGIRTKDAWNKMDIVLVDSFTEADIKKELKNVEVATNKKIALDILNDVMKRRLKTKELVGVSLKKIIKPQNAKASVVEFDPRQKLLQPNNLKNIRLSWDIHPNDEWKTVDLAFSFDADGRTYNTQARAFPIARPRDQNQIEPIATGAGGRLAKVSMPMALDPFYASLGLKRTMASDLPKQGMFNQHEADKIFNLWNKLFRVTISGQSINWGDSINSETEFKNMFVRASRLEQTDTKFASVFSTKIQGLYMLDNMFKIDQKKKMPEFLQTLYYGAKGVYETAGPYVLIAD